MKLDLSYEYGRRTNARVMVLGLVALALTGVLLLLKPDQTSDAVHDEPDVEVILEAPAG